LNSSTTVTMYRTAPIPARMYAVIENSSPISS
jgi:hypothetical protein